MNDPIFAGPFRLVALALAAVWVLCATADPVLARGATSSTGCLPASLKSTLSTIRKKFGPIDILSTHRPGARIAGSRKRSYHASCRAVDFKPRRNRAKVIAWLKSNHGGGLGTYSGRHSHIHIDNGPRVRFHKG